MISRSILAAAGAGLLAVGVALTGGSSVAAVDTASSSTDTSAAFALSHPVPPAVEVPAGQSLTAAFAAQTAVYGWLWAALAWHTDTLEPATARLVLDVASYWGPVLTATTLMTTMTVLTASL
jgi:hypothetical protein